MKTFLWSGLILAIGLCVSCVKDHIASPMSLEEYTALLNQLVAIDTSHTASYATARESILAQAEGYRKQWEELRAVTAPVEVTESHNAFVNALEEQYKTSLDAGQNTPASLAATEENVNEYAHYHADVGYARDDQAKAGCQLQAKLKEYNLTFNAAGVCSAANNPRVQGKTAGSQQNPVNDVYMLHDIIKESDGSSIRPNVDGFEYDTIYAKADQSLTIQFDNRNPAPFVFSFSVYKGNDERVKGSDFVAGTPAYAGVRVHTLTTTLSAGTYTYVDNVHPIAMRGTLIVVP
ncbi:hypothetical protein BN8_00447 [Fibrisoma limi BUZ 3]|uniref:Uncharacterized protein n=1 Tax=Fibrisoma limi BUZ 3 TaxID=1185876 RepID=I2GC95_9BACT|nr:hypothetical protein [Fibrisoma limi]CCH51519.1 hypothetical protein BN8_00447 [Fibrisoma limi BUZ 3]